MVSIVEGEGRVAGHYLEAGVCLCTVLAAIDTMLCDDSKFLAGSQETTPI